MDNLETIVAQPEEKYMTVDDIAGLLKLHKATIQKWCREGHLPAVKIGRQYRVRKSDFDFWYENNPTGSV